jgi:hypothetical protein
VVIGDAVEVSDGHDYERNKNPDEERFSTPG